MSAPLIRPTSGMATAAMICGIASIFTCGLTSIPAVIVGHLAVRETKTGERGGHGQAVTGLILGWVCVWGWAAFWLMWMVGIVAGVGG